MGEAQKRAFREKQPIRELSEEIQGRVFAHLLTA